ncbi:hypothetical protein ASPCADRAFT_163797 [Aspergillus carbonarius ITEM 5010]|uniref:J domain-containing protein n=1 Tax=Aspergillus carbonarius (strain ITEM 5010) TaxID=602072 RepID=A0A1R3RTI0_ASPC5|nr:hypothetical protein ASPCADRAFT_163797 [Aspergillus carbonarius ITEM 5010]
MSLPRLRPSAARLRYRINTHPSNHINTTPYTFTQRTPFSTTQFHHASAREPTYYEILDIPPTASQSEIKKQFYALSLKHHPDRNRDDPSASSRFARISSAYNTLSNASKRSIYDRDHNIHMHSSTHSTANPGQHPMGSYSSYSANLHTKGASYAGSRPASGLSKRRGAFRGPPPSFYAHGGYGSSRRPGPGATAAGEGGGGEKKKKVGEEDPASFIDRNTVYHFNARGHYKTQAREDERRQERRSRATGASINEKYIGSPGALAVRFAVVCGILMGAGAMTGLFHNDRVGGSKTTKSARRSDG